MKVHRFIFLFYFYSITAPPQNEENTRSLFHERSFTPRSNSSLSSRRPSFSTSNFGSPTFVDRTISTQRVLNSPFYNGRTIYGGASAYGRRLGRSSSELRTNLNNSVQIKPKNESNIENMALSKTARRILDTLEQYTTPVSDAKKIPVGPRKNTKQEGLFAKYTGANPYRKDSKVASNTELHVPTVPELLKMKQQLQESTETVRQIAKSSKSDLNKEEYKLPTVEEESSKHTSKIKTKVCAVRQKVTKETDSAEQVKLPAVSLPISTLPKFDFSVPPVPSFSKPSISVQPKEPIQKKTEPKLVHKEKVNLTTEYKFSDPLVIAENIETIIGVNNFKFSEPILKKQLINNFKVSDATEFKPKRVQKNNGEIQPASQLLTGSVMDVLGKKSPNLMDKFKPPEGTWECSVCMVRNQPNVTKCVACESPKVAAPSRNQSTDIFSKQSSSLMDQFKPQEGTWECSTCMVRNKPVAGKCVACETPKVTLQSVDTFAKQSSNIMDKFKPAEGTWECSTCMVRNKPNTTKCIACESPNVVQSSKNQSVDVISKPSPNIMDKFKPQEGSWECAVCMIRNQSENTRCAACGESRQTAKLPEPQTKPLPWGESVLYKPQTFSKNDNQTLNSFGNQFKPPKDTWECSSCMVRNKIEAEKCVACESLKPELKKKLNAGFGETFKKKDSEWECSSCMVKNTSDKTKCVCCEAAKPGSNLDDKKSGFTKFSFGVDKQATSKFTFGFKPGNNVPLQPQNSFVSTDTQKVTPVISVPFSSNAIAPSSKVSEPDSSKIMPQAPSLFATATTKVTDIHQSTQEKENATAKANSSFPSLPSVPDNSKPVFPSATPTTLSTNIFDSVKSESAGKPVFQFGASTAVSTNSDTKSLFSSTSTTLFASPSTTAAATPITFGTSKSDAEPPAKMPNFSFGQKVDISKTENTGSQASGTAFGFGTENKVSSFQFNATANTPSVTASQPTQNGFSFGSTASSSAGFSFGKSPASPAGIFNFGNSSSQVSEVCAIRLI